MNNINNYIAIIDYGAGNLRSVHKALEQLGYNSIITDDITTIKDSAGIILPGVGTFGALTQSLKEKNLFTLLIDELKNGKPYLGICIGLQILFEVGHENGKFEGFGIFKGETIKFQNLPKSLKVPHMGWNSIDIKNSSTILKNIPQESMFYFVHSYHVKTDNTDIVTSTTSYDYDFVSSIHHKNIFGTQFHPEKSGEQGLVLLDNFAKICN
jgi:imidazole glycerol-phosphate synthase subunit HisH